MLKKLLCMFGICGSLYVLLELLFRGRSHISMFFAGGFSAACIFFCCQFGKLKKACLFVKCLFGSAVITAVEFITGVIVNLWLRLRVWDYSDLPFNLLGQICLPFSFIWFLLTMPILSFGKLLCRSTQRASTASKKREMPASPSASGE